MWLVSRVLYTRLSWGQKARVWPMKLRKTAGFLMVSVSMALLFQMRRRPCALVFGVVLIRGLLLGMRGRSATWGTGNGPKVCEEISGAPSEVLDWGRRKAPWLRGGPAQR